MKEGRQKVERETLYEEVWSDPVTVVAARYGLSDVGLAKICKRLHIPLPRRGYWAKLKAGQMNTGSPAAQTHGPSKSVPSHCGLCSCLVFIGYPNSPFCLTM